MRKTLQKLYQKPKEVRDSYAFVAAGIFTAVVCVFWVTARLQTPIDGSAIVSDGVGPFTTLIKKSKEQLAALKSAVPVEQSAVEETATSSVDTNAATLIITEENKAAASAKASATATSSPEVTYKEVLIGTTTATSTQP